MPAMLAPLELFVGSSIIEKFHTSMPIIYKLLLCFMCLPLAAMAQPSDTQDSGWAHHVISDSEKMVWARGVVLDALTNPNNVNMVYSTQTLPYDTIQAG